MVLVTLKITVQRSILNKCIRLEVTEADKGHELSLPSCRFQVVASIPGGISFYYNVREGGGGVRKNLRI